MFYFKHNSCQIVFTIILTHTDTYTHTYRCRHYNMYTNSSDNLYLVYVVYHVLEHVLHSLGLDLYVVGHLSLPSLQVVAVVHEVVVLVAVDQY